MEVESLEHGFPPNVIPLRPGINPSTERLIEQDQVIYNLSPREIKVLDLASHGHASRQIALDLGISYNTVKEYRAITLLKWSLNSMIQAVDYGFETDVLQPDPSDKRIISPDIDKIIETEHEEFLLVVEGVTAVQSAKWHGMSESGVVKRRNRFKEKIGAWTWPHAVRLARENGISTKPDL